MPRSWKPFYPVIVLAMFACALPGIELSNSDAVSTSAAETVIAGLTQNVTDTLTPTSAPTLTRTFTPTLIYPTARFPSETPTITSTPQTETPSFQPTNELTSTLTPGTVTISVTRPTHCRTGPGRSFEIVGSLLVGMKAPVIARDPTSQYFYIDNPYVFTDYCWVWGEYAEFEGDPILLPAFTPPPTPTSTATLPPTLNFNLKGSGFQSCSGAFWMNLEITSESQYVFESVLVSLLDTDRNITRTLATDNFVAAIGCDGLSVNDKIPNDTAVLISSAKFNYNFKGNLMRASVTVCTKDGQQGACTTREIPLTP